MGFNDWMFLREKIYLLVEAQDETRRTLKDVVDDNRKLVSRVNDLEYELKRVKHELARVKGEGAI